MNKKLTVVIPSRTHENQVRFLARAARSIRGQSIANQLELEILVGVDKGEKLSDTVCADLGIVCVESHGRSQAAALNAAIERVDGDLVAFLEDDDEWTPRYAECGLQCLSRCGFVSSTQLEQDASGAIVRVNDFPTPSGWLMPVSTLRKIGGFDETYRYHIDNEWLGRLSESGLPRIHLVEAYAPVDLRFALQVRPWLANVIRLSAGRCQLVRHPLGMPLVKRMVHEGSGMAQIASDESSRRVSREEIARLKTRFGRIPW